MHWNWNLTEIRTNEKSWSLSTCYWLSSMTHIHSHKLTGSVTKPTYIVLAQLSYWLCVFELESIKANQFWFRLRSDMPTFDFLSSNEVITKNEFSTIRYLRVAEARQWTTDGGMIWQKFRIKKNLWKQLRNNKYCHRVWRANRTQQTVLCINCWRHISLGTQLIGHCCVLFCVIIGSSIRANINRRRNNLVESDNNKKTICDPLLRLFLCFALSFSFSLAVSPVVIARRLSEINYFENNHKILSRNECSAESVGCFDNILCSLLSLWFADATSTVVMIRLRWLTFVCFLLIFFLHTNTHTLFAWDFSKCFQFHSSLFRLQSVIYEAQEK